MEFVINSDDFNDVIEKCISILPSKTTNTIIFNFLLKLKDNKLTIISTNFENIIFKEIEVKGKENGQVLVSANMLYKIISKFKDVDVFVKVKKNYFCLKIFESEYKLKYDFNTDDFPIMEYDSSVSNYFMVNSIILKRIINKILFAIDSNQQINNVLSGALFQPRNLGLRTVATDGNIMSIYTDKNNLENNNINNKKDIVISKKTLDLIYKNILNLDSAIKISFDDNCIIFEFEKTTIVSLLLSDDYPNYKEIIPKDFKNIVKLNKNNLLNTLDRLSVFADPFFNNLVIFNFNENMFFLKCISEMGRGYDEMKLQEKSNLNNFLIGFNVLKFISFLFEIDSENIYLKMNTRNDPCLIIPENENEDMKIIMMPINLNDEILNENS